MNYSKITTEIFIKRMMDIDLNYDYSKVEYENMHKKVKVGCKRHGEFMQTPINLLNGFLCKHCKKDMMKKTKLINILNRCTEIHEGKYDYSMVKYEEMISEVIIICNEHGEFRQSLNNHVNQGKGCPKCVKNFKLEKTDFTERSNVIHKCFYNYSKSEFKNVATKVVIVCPIHGEFEQTPNNHMKGVGCPMCSISKGERAISDLLDNHNINYIIQKKFNDCRDKNRLPFDFYLPNENTIIEYDGRQHFESFDIFGGIENFKITQKHDQIKNEYCKNNNIKLIRMTYKDNINDILDIINTDFKK